MSKPLDPTGIAAQLRARLNRTCGPLDHASAWTDYYYHSYREPGYEALAGADACYHFTDAAHYAYWAASELAGAGMAYFHSAANRPRGALEYISKGYGRRYVWAVEGLHEALIESAQPRGAVERYDARRREFAIAFNPQLQAAGVVNQKGGKNPQAAADVIGMFADELRQVCGWLELTNQCFLCRGIQTALDDTRRVLHTPPDQTQKPHRTKKKKSGFWPEVAH